DHHEGDDQSSNEDARHADGMADEVKWIEPVIAAGDPGGVAANEQETADAADPAIANATSQPARSRRQRSSPAHGRATHSARSTTSREQRPARQSSVAAAMAPDEALRGTIDAHSATAVARMGWPNEPIGAERAVAATVLAALHGTLAAGALAALHKT